MELNAFARMIGIAALSLSLSGCLWAPDLDRIRKDIEKQIPGASFDCEIAVSLGPVALALAPDAREARGYLRDVRSVEVAVYEARDLPADFRVRLPAALERMVEEDGWEIAVKTLERDETAWVLCKEDSGSAGGICVVALGEGELVLARVRGDLVETLKRALRENAGPGQLARGIRSRLGDA
jgi:hypothetical protein